MYDKQLIEKVCNVTCNASDITMPQTDIKYDTDNPFRKYYNVNSIVTAINKYVNGEWEDKTLANWACIYDWILNGGFDDNVTEDLNSFETFFMNTLSWDLDGLSFFDEDCWTDCDISIEDEIAFYKNFDHIWQTRADWKVTYSTVGKLCKENEDYFAVLINKNTKEYMILCSDYINDGYNDDVFNEVDEDEFIALIEQLKDDGYTILPNAEYFYYDEISN